MTESAPKKVLSFGETLWDVLPSGPSLGGAPLNLAYRLNTLGDHAFMVTRLGRDEYGQMAALRMAELGMDTTHIQWDDHRATGTVDVQVDAQGVPEFTIHPDVAYDAIEVTYELMEIVKAIDAFCFGTLAQRCPASALALTRLLDMAGPMPRFLDLNLRPECFSWNSITKALRDATVVKLNENEVRSVAWGFETPGEPLPDFCRFLIDRCQLDACVVTLGEKGALAMNASGEQIYEPGYQVEVVDTCGSGDAFSAAFLHAYLRKRPLAECCRLGCGLGALVATQPGATTQLAPGALDDFLNSPPPRIKDPARGG